MINKLHGKPELNKVVGMEEKTAFEYLNNLGYEMRVVNRNGSPIMLKADYNDKRLNVFVESGFVSNIDKLG